MKHSFVRLLCALGLLAAAVVVPLHPATAQPVVFSIETSTGRDTLWYGGPGSIIFKVDPHGADVAALTFPLLVSFSNGNIIGPVDVCSDIRYYTDLCGAYDPCFEPPPPDPATDPDSMLFGILDFGGSGCWPDDNGAAIIDLIPLDTGSFTIDTIFLPPANHLSALDIFANTLPIEWHSKTITVAPCPVVMGDVDNNDLINTADVIYLIGYMFKGGSPPAPWWQVGDLDCSGSVTASDVMHLIGYIFLGKDMPCHCNVP